jgi:hypothetical protein
MTVKVRAQADSHCVSFKTIMRTAAFRHGVNDVRKGRAPRFDAEWGDDIWDYEKGRQFGIISPRSMAIVIDGQLNPEAVDFFRLHNRDICQ